MKKLIFKFGDTRNVCEVLKEGLLGFRPMFNESFAILSAYFLKHLAASIAFLIPLIFLWSAGRRRIKSKGLIYVFSGFFIGFLTQLIGGFLGAYVYQLPLLPLILRQQDMSAQEIAKTVSFYNTVFDTAYLSALFASLMLIAYGTYKLLNDLTGTTP